MDDNKDTLLVGVELKAASLFQFILLLASLNENGKQLVPSGIKHLLTGDHRSLEGQGDINTIRSPTTSESSSSTRRLYTKRAQESVLIEFINFSNHGTRMLSSTSPSSVFFLFLFSMCTSYIYMKTQPILTNPVLTG